MLILPYVTDTIQNRYGADIENCVDNPNAEYCSLVSNASIDEKYENISVNDTTQAVTIVIYRDYNRGEEADVILSLYFSPNIVEDVGTPATLDISFLYPSIAIIFTMGAIALTKKIARR